MAGTREHSTVRTQSRQGSNKRWHTQGQTAERTDSTTRNGFLNHAFAPVISQQLARLGQPRQIEREFFNSLSHLALLYGFAIPDIHTAGYPYPQNIVQAFDGARQAMKALRPELDVMIVHDEAHASCIATIKTFDTGGWLYYISVQPLQRLLDTRKTKAQGTLLLSIFSYLFQMVRIPYFTYGYLDDVYEMVSNWYEDDPEAFDEEEFAGIREEYRAMKYFGSRLFKSIQHPYHMQQFENRVQRFVPKTAHDAALLAVSTKLLCLHTKYPDRSLFDNCKAELIEPNREDQVMLDQYVSFFWKGEGTVYERVMEMVNMNFQEIACMEEPTTVQLFDAPQQEERHDLDFDQQLFGCICELNEYLNEV